MVRSNEVHKRKAPKAQVADAPQPAVNILDCSGGKFIVIWRLGDVEECRRNVFCNSGDVLAINMAKHVFAKDKDGNHLYEIEKPEPQAGTLGISGYQCSWCGRQIFWGTPEDPTDLEGRANKHRLECPQRPGANPPTPETEPPPPAAASSEPAAPAATAPLPPPMASPAPAAAPGNGHVGVRLVVEDIVEENLEEEIVIKLRPLS